MSEQTRPLASTSLAALDAPPPPPALSSSPNLKRRSTRHNMTQAQQEELDVCAVCRDDPRKKKKLMGDVWIECGQCKAWFHWMCVRGSSHESFDQIDKWFCSSCLASSASTSQPLAISYRTPVRKSLRASAQTRLDYANLDQHLPADAHRWMKVLASRALQPDIFKRYAAEDLTDEWLYGNPEAFKEPFVVESPEGLGMKMPRDDLGIEEIARIVGEDTPLEVIDCAAQSSLANWTLGQWATYYNNPNRDKIRNVISLEVSESPLGKEVEPPDVVKRLSWVDKFWPENKRGAGEYPTVMRYCLMSVKDCFTDVHCDFSASSVFYHILRGGKTFYFWRPTQANLAAYEKWSGSKELQENTWFGDMCDKTYAISLKPGNTMIIPSGWPHAVYTPADSLVFGGNFLHSLDIDLQLQLYQIELNTKVPKKFRFPHFVKLLWMVGFAYLARLEAIAPPEPLPQDLSPRVLLGLKKLAQFLIDQAGRFAKGSQASEARRKIARDNVPWDVVPDPAHTAGHLWARVMARLAEDLDALCASSEGGDVKVEERSVSPALTKKATNGSAAQPTPSPATTAPKRKPSAAALSGSPATKKQLAPRPIAAKPTAPPRRPSSTSTPATEGEDQGDIISRSSLPLTTTVYLRPMVDPLDRTHTERPAEVRVGTQTNEVVRRQVGWSAAEGREVVWVEKRTQVVTVERVRWPPSDQSETAAAGEASELASQYFARGAEVKVRAEEEGQGSSLPSPAPSGAGTQEPRAAIANLLNPVQPMDMAQ